MNLNASLYLQKKEIRLFDFVVYLQITLCQGFSKSVQILFDTRAHLSESFLFFISLLALQVILTEFALCITICLS